MEFRSKSPVDERRDLKAFREILGHKKVTMTLRDAHLSQEHKKRAVRFLSGLMHSVKFDMSQNVTFSEKIEKKEARQ